MIKKQVIINSQLINYYKHGDGKIPLVFLHGWRSEGLVWSKVISLLDSKFTIYALDLPGFGQSPPPKKPFEVSDYAEVVSELICKLGLASASIVGHSVGGRIAIKLAADHPKLVRSLVLVDSAGFVTDAGRKRLIGIFASLLKPIFRPVFMQGPRKMIYRMLGADDYVETPELVETFKLIVAEDLSKKLVQIKCPTLIVWGENDKETPLEFGRKMKELIVGSRLEILPKAGHFSFLDREAEFVSTLGRFYEEV